MTRLIVNASCRVAVTVMLVATLLLVMMDMARAETVEESELCSGAGGEDGCWLQITERDSCYLWKRYPLPEESVTWSGDCPGGKASGMGTEVRTYRTWEGEWTTSSGEGPYVDGKLHGHWVFRWADGGGSEGSYVDGKEHGHWGLRYADGSDSEGPYVDGKRNGHWVFRGANGDVTEGPYVDGKRHGHWVLRWGGDVLEGPYVDDKEHGHWVVRRADGSCNNVEYSRGDIVSSSDC